ncbi:hypothetical protein [Streptococcus suis]|uniref:hypothetical protein n=1 Tax=Streptococcus suis TaxID=1307 RepID=UPI001EF11705|nr:hypothetical protein [Streptococcus suis]MBS8089033.1 hypothetical protein [Streptococcus suis]NQS09070.1 hypothetical protein [Streptococcus suis]
MKTEFINEKAQSAFNLNIITSPIVAIILLLVGDSLGAVIFTPISFLLPFSETLSVSFELFAFAFISLMVILWARYIENILRLVVRKSPTGESTHYFFFMIK